MLYLHYCRRCDVIRMLNGHKPACPACGQPLHELRTAFVQYTSLSEPERSKLLAQVRRTYSS